VLDEQIKIYDKKILKATNLSEAEKMNTGIFGFGGKRRKSLFKKSFFKKKRTKRRTKKRRSRKRRKTKRRIYKVRKTRRKLKGGLKKRWAKLKKKNAKAKRLSEAMRKGSQLPHNVIQKIQDVEPAASKKEKYERFMDSFVFKKKLNTSM
jgi:hypothetical protein